MEHLGEFVIAKLNKKINTLEKILEMKPKVIELLTQFNGMACSSNKKKMLDKVKAIDPNFSLQVKRSTCYQPYVLVIDYTHDGETRHLLHIGVENNIMEITKLSSGLKTCCGYMVDEIKRIRRMINKFDAITKYSDVEVKHYGTTIQIEIKNVL